MFTDYAKTESIDSVVTKKFFKYIGQPIDLRDKIKPLFLDELRRSIPINAW